jgi:hypothetical protein
MIYTTQQLQDFSQEQLQAIQYRLLTFKTEPDSGLRRSYSHTYSTDQTELEQHQMLMRLQGFQTHLIPVKLTRPPAQALSPDDPERHTRTLACIRQLAASLQDENQTAEQSV